MKARYPDLDQFGDPLWYDENGVPRFAVFSPELSADPYARQAALLQGCCPRCRALTKICVSSQELAPDIQVDVHVRGGAVYGLLPHFEHCSHIAIPEIVGTLEVWRRVDLLVWRRVFTGGEHAKR